MKCFDLIFVLAAALVLRAHAKPEPEPAKGQQIAFSRFRSSGDILEARNAEGANGKIDIDTAVDDNADDDVDVDVDVDVDEIANTNGNRKKGSEASSGRLFLKKFLLFKNMFGQEQKPPVIPIIITGATGTGSYVTPTSPISVTSTGSIPTATGTINTSPTSATAATAATAGTAAAGRKKVPQQQQDQANVAAAVNEQQLQAALAAGAQEYVVTDQEILGTSDAKASRAPTRVNLRRPNAKNGQIVTVRIPPRYRNYFKNGQKVMLNTKKRPVKRRVVQRRRVNRFSRRRVGGKRRRVYN